MDPSSPDTEVRRKNSFDLGLWFYVYTSILFGDLHAPTKSSYGLHHVQDRLNRLLEFFAQDFRFSAPESKKGWFEYGTKIVDDNRLELIRQELSVEFGDQISAMMTFAYGCSVLAEGANKTEELDLKPVRERVLYDAKFAGVSRLRLTQFFEDPKRHFGNLTQLVFGDSKPRDAVFIVHGQNHEIRDSVDLFLRDLGVETIVMDAEAHMGRTLPEKFEALANNCKFAIFILSADDKLTYASSGKLVRRARQNVILEVGYFWGALGRASKCAFLVESTDGMERSCPKCAQR